MRQLARKPMLLGFLLSLFLWPLFGNVVVALSVGLLLAFLISMVDSLLLLQRSRQQTKTTAKSQDQLPPPAP